tara:strand:- start:654 stop:1211 length:558 start_codon:yes stop_codon:yes gene_type:complete
MNVKMLKAVVAGLVLSVSGFANAGLIFSDNTNITTSGQSDIASFSSIGFEDYTNIIFSVDARGDFGENESNEYIEFLIDGVNFGQYTWDTFGVTSSTGSSNISSIDKLISFSFNISALQWANFISDDSVQVTWNNGSGVGDWSNNYIGYVNYEINGVASQVPEPTTLAIFALGIMGLASRRFKKQ